MKFYHMLENYIIIKRKETTSVCFNLVVVKACVYIYIYFIILAFVLFPHSFLPSLGVDLGEDFETCSWIMNEERESESVNIVTCSGWEENRRPKSFSDPFLFFIQCQCSPLSFNKISIIPYMFVGTALA